MDLVLIKLVDLSFNGVFLDPHCRYTQPTGGSSFNQTGGHEFEWGVLRYGLQVDLVLIKLVDMSINGVFSYSHCRYTQGLQVDLVLIKLVDMSFNGVFLDSHCRYTGPTGGSSFNQTGGHEF